MSTIEVLVDCIISFTGLLGRYVQPQDILKILHQQLAFFQLLAELQMPTADTMRILMGETFNPCVQLQDMMSVLCLLSCKAAGSLVTYCLI